MQSHNKNHFGFNDSDEEENKESKNDGRILTDSVDNVMKNKFLILKQMFFKNAYQNGYNCHLAFRVISLYLYCEFKPSDQLEIQFNLVEEVSRFIQAQIKKQDLRGIQKCMDLLMVPKLKERVPDMNFRLWKIKVLAGLKKYYARNHLKKDKKKASVVMREFCREELKKENIKHNESIYTEIIDILIGEQKIILNSKKAHGKNFQAIQNGNNIIRTLEKSEQMIIPKYQEQLMFAYWEIAKLHNQLHYVTYAKKYAETALNISQRINDRRISTAARTLLDNLVAM